MKNYKFPRTYADLESAPWCHSYERSNRTHGWECFIHVYDDWLPPDHEYGERCSAIGVTLKDALFDLRELWDNYMHPPK